YEHGQTLGQYLEAHKMGNDRLRDLLSSLLDGLDVVHTRATLHRDLKPSNIILRPDESPVLIDFGAARNFESRNSRSVTTIATAGYSPPEQSIGGQQGPWTDLYALGAIAYRIVSGNTPPDSLRRLRKDPLVPASSLDVEYDPTILRTIDWMLKIDESERPISVDAVRNSLGGAVFAAGQNTVGNAASAQQQKSWMLSIDEAKRPSSVDEIRTALQGRAAVPTFAAAAANQEVTAPKSPNVVARPWLTLGAGAVLLLGGASIIGFFGIEYHRHQNGVSQQNTPMQEEAARIQALSRELSAAGQDVQLIQALRRKCGDDCPSELTSEINQRLQQTERSKQQDHVAEKSQAGLDRKAVAAMYFDKLIRANEDVGLLRDFIEECRRDAACGFLSQAEAKYREAELLHRQSEEAKLRLKDIDTQRHNQSGNDAPQQSPSVSLIQNKRESENEFADRTGQSILAIKDRFAATGVLSCPWGNGTAQLTGASNIITTAAHVFYDRTADTCTPRAALGQCVFETETSKGRVSARVGSLVAAGWKCPTLPHHRNDWAVARLERAINTVKPYEVVSISRFIISEGEPLLAVESPSIDYSKGKFIHNCETKGSY
ncbi:MAG: protein kinase, partial [Candidatus Afipia apatlaquensis]|nr:protein kinase [Candidatus Afipia apatlaquensis]